MPDFQVAALYMAHQNWCELPANIDEIRCCKMRAHSLYAIHLKPLLITSHVDLMQNFGSRVLALFAPCRISNILRGLRRFVFIPNCRLPSFGKKTLSSCGQVFVSALGRACY
jgi:hypothetical protein